MKTMKEKDIKKIVRAGYADIVRKKGGGCSPTKPCCRSTQAAETSKNVGYSDKDLGTVPEGANLGLGCGNPVALASLRKGDVVLDLGSGAGFDCFLAARKVGSQGRVIGVDMTPEMVEKARDNAEKGKYSNVEFRLGEIEHLPVADHAVDVVISNCVINLSPDKRRVFQEAYRVLKPGGRLLVSDIVLLQELPQHIRSSAAAYVGCISGAMLKNDYLRVLQEAGFQQVTVVDETTFPVEVTEDGSAHKVLIKKQQLTAEEVKKVSSSVLSLKVHAEKPATL